jgi:4-diphosphocytidyl-2-C-methyl-D-erythritol kinase
MNRGAVDREVWLAPAKINLWLRVGPRRPDGMHEIDTGYQAIDLADRVEITRAAEGEDVACAVGGEFAAGIPQGDANLAARAARLLADRTGHDLRVRIEIEKRIPAGAGLGGASSDAAAVLLALARRFAVPDPERTLVDLAADVGADVPFFLSGGTRRAGGIGDELEPASPPSERWGILVWPGVHVATGEAYRWLDEARGAESPPLPSAGTAVEGNDFESVVGERHPVVGRVREILSAGPGRRIGMSGSGSAWYALYASEEERDKELPQVAEAFAEVEGARHWAIDCRSDGVRPRRPAHDVAGAGR